MLARINGRDMLRAARHLGRTNDEGKPVMGANLFANIDPELYAGIESVSALAGLSKKAIIEATLADRMGVDHPHLFRVRGAWKKYRAGERG